MIINRKILFIDYIDERGHLNFDTIHINALVRAGFEVHLALHATIADRMCFPAEMYDALIPEWLDKKPGRHPIANRLKFIGSLIYLKKHIRISDYDDLIIAKCDSISLSLIPLCRNKYIICHGNYKDFDNILKKWCLKRLSKNNRFIVFNENMLRPFTDYGVNDVFIVSHGCLPKSAPSGICNIPLKSSEHLIFHPSSKYDLKFAKDIVRQEFLDFLNKNDILLVLKDFPYQVPDSSNIQLLNSYIDADSYSYIFNRSDIILLCYPEEFKYCVSGVSFECISYGKKILYLDNPTFDYCKGLFNYNPSFDSISSLKVKISAIICDETKHCIVSDKDIEPDYSFLIPPKYEKLVSVIIPSYKPGDYLWECLDSLINQTFDRNLYEIIIILNGEKEPFYNRIETFFANKRDTPEYNLVFSEVAGVSKARNIGIDLSRGEYICFVDDDDIVSQTYLDELFQKVGRHLVSISNALAFNDGTEKIPFKYRKSYCFDKNSHNGIQSINSAKTFFSGPVFKMIHREIIGERRFEESFINGEDTLFMFLISDRIKKIAFTSEQAIYYRRVRNCGSTSNMKFLSFRIKRIFKMSTKIVTYYFKRPWDYNFSFFVTRILSILKSLFYIKY